MFPAVPSAGFCGNRNVSLEVPQQTWGDNQSEFPECPRRIFGWNCKGFCCTHNKVPEWNESSGFAKLNFKCISNQFPVLHTAGNIGKPLQILKRDGNSQQGSRIPDQVVAAGLKSVHKRK